MVVYSKFNKPYKLVGKPKKVPGGSIYDVSGEPGIQVKLLDKAGRTDEMERTVEDSIGGMGMLDVTPIETVYQNNRFAGFVMEKPAMPEQKTDPVPPEIPVQDKAIVTPPPTASGPLPLIVMIAAGIIMTAVLILAVFPSLSASMDPSVRTVQFSGIPMAAAGWLLLLFVLIKSGGVDWKCTILGILAFIVGAVLCNILITILVYLFYGAKALFAALLPTVITIVIVVAIIKSLLGH